MVATGMEENIAEEIRKARWGRSVVDDVRTRVSSRFVTGGSTVAVDPCL